MSIIRSLNMIRLYQTEWQGIQFESFAKLSTTKLADAKFYDKFYQAFFNVIITGKILTLIGENKKRQWRNLFCHDLIMITKNMCYQ